MRVSSLLFFKKVNLSITIAVYGAMGTRVLPITLDLFPATFIARSCHSPTLQQGLDDVRARRAGLYRRRAVWWEHLL